MKELSVSEVKLVSAGKSLTQLSWDECVAAVGGGALGMILAKPLLASASIGDFAALLGYLGAFSAGSNLGLILCHAAFPEDYKNS
jgi:hypothetical protein